MLKYVPVLRYRKEERAGLRSVSISDKTLPLLEIMRELPGLYRTGTFQQRYLEDFNSYNFPFLLDFPIYFHVIGSTTTSIRNFLRPLKQNPNNRLLLFEQLSANQNIIPVISYDTERPYIAGTYQSDAIRLRRSYGRLGFRIFENQDFNRVLNDINTAITQNDFLLYDIDTAPHTSPVLQGKYAAISALKRQKRCNTVLIRSAINPDIVFNRLVDNQPVVEADNSLLTAYSNYGFDAFSDYAGIRKDRTITDGGPLEPSVGFLYYSWQGNCFIGFKGRVGDWAEFTNHVRPTVINSLTWNSYSQRHRQTCRGCLEIAGVPGNQAAKWKRISLMHYIHTMEEFL